MHHRAYGIASVHELTNDDGPCSPRGACNEDSWLEHTHLSDVDWY